MRPLHLCLQVAVLSNDLLEEKFTIVALHPGWVQTGEPHKPGCDQAVELRCSFKCCAASLLRCKQQVYAGAFYMDIFAHRELWVLFIYP